MAQWVQICIARLYHLSLIAETHIVEDTDSLYVDV